MKGYKYLVGIDEVGRGPLAGPVTVCAVSIFNSSKKSKSLIGHFRDSKKLSPNKRLVLFEKAISAQKKGLINFSISSISASYIDRLGISKALGKAIEGVLKKLNLPPKKCLVLLDGSLKAPPEYIFQKTIIKGDQKVRIIGCASVLAKVKRDKSMIKQSGKYLGYGFERNKGYGTKKHIEAIKKFGPCQIHRQSFLQKIQVSLN